MPDTWLTLTEAADLLGISSWTARRWAREGRLQAEVRSGPYGPQYYVPAVHVEAILRARQEPLPAEFRDGATDGSQSDVEPVNEAADDALAALRDEFRRFVQEQEARWQAVSQELAGLRRELEGMRRAAAAGPDGEEEKARRRRWLW